MKTAIIGYNGFVGSNILLNKNMTDKYNSKNINKIKGRSYDLIISTGFSGTKFIINKNPYDDILNIKNQKKLLSSVKAQRIVHISTIDVYDRKKNVDEKSKINSSKLDNYGSNRRDIENFIISNFNKYHIIRLPMLFGHNLNKNILFDLIKKKFIHNIPYYSTLQWYNVQNLWKDIKIIIDNNIDIINLVSEPIRTKLIIDKFFNYKNEELNLEKKIDTEIKSIHSSKFSKKNNYLYSKFEILKDLEIFIKNQLSGG